jgi:hypothetical protein
LAALLVIGWVVSPALAQTYGDARRDASDFLDRASRVSSARQMNPVRALLQKEVERVEWEDNTLAEVVDWLKAQSTEYGKVNVVVRWKPLEIESIDADSTVRLQMEHSNVKDVLDEVLAQLSDIDPLTYLGEGNKLTISTRSDFDRRLYTRSYDIADIMMKVRNFSGSPQIEIDQQQQGGGGGGASGQVNVQSIFQGGGGGGGNDDEDEGEEEEEERADDIMEFVRTIVEPDTWQENGGLGTMAVLNKQLVVRNTLTVHEILGGPMHFGE